MALGRRSRRLQTLVSILSEVPGVEPVRWGEEVVASFARSLDALADRLGSDGVYVSIGDAGEVDGELRLTARILVSEGASVAFVALPEAASGTDSRSYSVTVTLSGEGLEAALRALLADEEESVPADARESLSRLIAQAPFEDSRPAVLSQLFLESYRDLTLEMEAARERERARVEVRSKLEQTERNRAYAALARGLGHHYNNRLAVIMARADLLARIHADPTVQRCASEIAEACRSCCDFLVRFNSYASRMPVNPVAREKMDDIVRQALQNLDAFIAACSAVRGDPVRVRQDLNCPHVVLIPRDDLQAAVEALITNAVEAMPEGGDLSITTWDDGGWAVLEVRDSGIGMSEKVASKVFNPFYTTKGAGHAGLSLSHVHSAVVQHGGSIEVSTEETKGAVFTIRLPGTGLASQPVPGPRRRAGSGPVLVVEDEDDVRNALCELLAAMDYDVVGARGGRQAEKAAAEREPGLVLTDLGVPDLTAFELARRLRRAGLAVPIILLTGWVREVDTAAASDAGIDMVLTKPISAEDLVAALRAFGVEG